MTAINAYTGYVEETDAELREAAEILADAAADRFMDFAPLGGRAGANGLAVSGSEKTSSAGHPVAPGRPHRSC